MFTGLIDHCGLIQQIEAIPSGVKLSIRSQFESLNLGESIAIDGACLTVVEAQGQDFSLELSQETLDLTIAHQYRPGSRANLERSLALNDRLGGHFVSGHVDQTAKILAMTPHDDFHELIIGDFGAENLNYMIHKGSIAINGVSLTINKILNDTVSIMLIPHTWDITSLSSLKIDDRVNIEFDLLAKMIAKQLRGLSHDNTIRIN